MGFISQKRDDMKTQLHWVGSLRSIYYTMCFPLTNSMELSPSRVAATEELPSNIWNPEFHYRVYKNPSLGPRPGPDKVIHLHIMQDHKSWSLFVTFPPIIHIHFSSNPFCYIPYQSHPNALRFFLVSIPFYLQAVQIHSANGVKLLEAWRGVLSSTPPYK
jgi:hypothetical protein